MLMGKLFITVGGGNDGLCGPGLVSLVFKSPRPLF